MRVGEMSESAVNDQPPSVHLADSTGVRSTGMHESRDLVIGVTPRQIHIQQTEIFESYGSQVLGVPFSDVGVTRNQHQPHVSVESPILQ